MQLSAMKSMYYALLLFLIHLTHAQNTTCPSGTFQTSDGACKVCPPGTWRDASFRRNPVDRCILCPAGKFNPNPGAQGPDLCRRCPELTFSSQRGSLKCEPCPKGTLSGAGASKCLVCEPGTEIRKNAKLGCTPCPRGSYNPDSNGKCRRCDDGQTSPLGATSMIQCTSCPPGEASEFYDLSDGPFGTECLPCSRGTFKPSRSGPCRSCPDGFISNENRTECMPCPPGTFEPVLGSTCRECFPKFEAKGFGNYRCRRIGGSCPKTFFEDANGDCRDCEQGFKLNIRENKCEKCPPGTVSIGGVQAVCERCPRGQKPDSRQGVCECPRGHRKSRLGGCEPCDKGEYQNHRNPTTSCFDCSPGTYSNEIGAKRCKPCPAGMVSSLFRATKCTPCPPGTRKGLGYQDSECLSVTTNCPPGFRRRGRVPFLRCLPVICKPDADEGDVGKTCAVCDPNQFLNPKRTFCQDCPDNSISFGGLVTKCQECPDGKVQDFYELSTCSCRANGRGLQGGKCKPCPPGSFSSHTSEVCELCPPGKFADKSGSERCTLCPVDTIATEEGAVRCKKCPVGTIGNRRPRFSFGEEGGTKCIKIPA